jgi:DNA-binding phage protein
MLALRQVAMAQGGIAAMARRAKITREAAYRILSTSGNPELRSLTAILEAAGLRLSVKPIDAAPKAAQRPARYKLSKRPRAL